MRDKTLENVAAVIYEKLMHGVEKSIVISLFFSPITVLEFHAPAAEEYGKIRAQLERKGMPIGPMDLLVAGRARSEGLILVTNNTREFERVESLRAEDWARDERI